MHNGDKIILDLCGGTGSWSRPYKDAGYDVRVITLPEYNVENITPVYGGIMFLKADGCFEIIHYGKISGILAAPPCTEFSVAKGNKPRDLKDGMKTVEHCMRIIWDVQQHTTLDFWALENPRGLLRRFLGVPKYTFEQWQFGENKIKATDIWGYFTPPTPTVKARPSGLSITSASGRTNARDWAKCEYPPEYADYINHFRGDAKRAAARAITPSGFADAFYRANKPKACAGGCKNSN